MNINRKYWWRYQTCIPLGWTLWEVTFSHTITRTYMLSTKATRMLKKAETGSNRRVCAGAKSFTSSKVYRYVTERTELFNSWTCRHPERASCQQQYQAVSCGNEQSPEIIWDHLSCSLLWTATAQQRPVGALSWQCKGGVREVQVIERRVRRRMWQEREELMDSNREEKRVKMFGVLGGRKNVKAQLTAKIREQSKTWQTGEAWSAQWVRVKQHKPTETPRGQAKKQQLTGLHADELHPAWAGACLELQSSSAEQ